MNTWGDIYKVWEKANVPDVDIATFDVKLHKNSYPWLCKERGTQSFQESNPVNTTAFHLASYLKEKDGELIAAYKIMAFAKSIGSEHVVSKSILDSVFKV